MFSGVHHVAVICSDYQVSKDFYVRIMGFDIIGENYREERQSYKLDLHVPGGVLEDAISHLSRHGIQCESIRVDEYTGRRFTFFADPDGLPLELYEVNDQT